MTDSKEIFTQWFGRGLEIEDCDPSLYLQNYFFDRFEYNTEQRLWISFIYGTTYYWPTSYVVWNEFPDMELVGLERLRDWNNTNYKRLRYQTDTKWNKGHLPAQFESYRDFVGDRTQREALTANFVGDPIKDFYSLWDTVNSWHKFGRYTSWFYIQTLKQTCAIDVDVDSLWFHDRSGSKSHRNGMCYAMGKPEWVDSKKNKVKLDATQIDFLEANGREILQEVKLRYPHVADKADFFAMETSLCSFKKLYRRSRGRYLGFYIDRQAEEIKKVQADNWEGIDWTPLWDARKESLEEKWLTDIVDPELYNLYLDTGNFEPADRNAGGLESFFV